jgi:rhomboid protease GluP
VNHESPQTSGDARPSTDEEVEARFDEELEKRRPWLWWTTALVTATCVAWIAGLAWYQHEPNAQELMAIGGNFGLNTLDGQPWRLVSHLFLHAGFLHLLFNMIALADFGGQCERLFGPVRYLALYLLSGIGGGVMSAMANPFQVSVGASGAIFGLLGGLIALMMLREDEVPVAVLKARLYSLLALVGYSVIASSNGAPIDHMAHLGGFITGGACALFLAPSPAARPGPRWGLLVGGAMAYALVVGGLLASVQPPPDERMAAWRAQQRYLEDMKWLGPRERELNQRAEKAVRTAQRPESRAEIRAIAAGWQDIRDRFTEHAKHRDDLGDLVKYATLKAKAYTSLADSPADASEFNELMKEIRGMESFFAGMRALR